MQRVLRPASGVTLGMRVTPKAAVIRLLDLAPVLSDGPRSPGRLDVLKPALQHHRAGAGGLHDSAVLGWRHQLDQSLLAAVSPPWTVPVT